MIRFYSPRDAYGEFSNFSRHPVLFDGLVWPTSEHLFQALKFTDPTLRDRVRMAGSPALAAEMGRDRSLPGRSKSTGWAISGTTIQGSPREGSDGGLESQPGRNGVSTEPVFARLKDVAMFRTVEAKFSQDLDCRAVLLSTGNAVLVEDALHDPYWGWGSSRVGLNKLGRILMMVRAGFISERAHP